MPHGRGRVVLALAAALAVLAAGTGVVVHDRNRSEDRRDPDRAAAPGAGAPTPEAVPDPDAAGGGRDDTDDGPGGLVKRLLDALGGGAGGDVTGAALEDCASALAAAPVGSAGLLPDRKAGTDPDAQLHQIADALQGLRMLRFERVPVPVYVTADEMSRRVRAELMRSSSPDETAAEARGLVALGALPPGADLEALTAEALGGQVAGFYDPDTGELVVARSGTSGGLDGQSRIVLAHELDHALTDQAIGLPDDVDRPEPGAEDAALGRLALVEGDATLAMQQYGLAYVPLLDQLSGLGGALASQEQLARLPDYLQRSLVFPYVAGLSFACALHRAGGWAAVDAAYRRPPTSTAQVLFPERYAAHEAPVDPRGPAAPGPGWTPLPRRSFGAAELRWLLEAPGGRPDRAVDDAARRTAGWAGGELQVWVDGDRTATGVALVQHAGQAPLCATMAAWYTAAFGGGTRVDRLPGEELAVDGARQDAVVRCQGDDVRIGIAPDFGTARAIAA